MTAEAGGTRRRPTRRRLIAGAAALGALAGCTSIAIGQRKSETPGDDAALLNSALGLEYEAIAAYAAALAGGALAEDEKKLAGAFQSDHRRHAEALAAAIARLGAAPVGAKPAADYRFAPAELAARGDALRFLIGFEKGLALAHLGAVPAFAERALAKGAAGILGVESMHWATLRRALGEDPVPSPFLG